MTVVHEMMLVIPQAGGALLCAGILFTLFIYYLFKRNDPKRILRQKVEHLNPKELATYERCLANRIKSIKRNPEKFSVKEMAEVFNMDYLPTAAKYVDECIYRFICENKKPKDVLDAMKKMTLCKSRDHNHPPREKAWVLHRSIEKLFSERYNTEEGRKLIADWVASHSHTPDRILFALAHSTMLPMPVRAKPRVANEMSTHGMHGNHVAQGNESFSRTTLMLKSTVDRNGKRHFA